MVTANNDKSQENSFTLQETNKNNGNKIIEL